MKDQPDGVPRIIGFYTVMKETKWTSKNGMQDGASCFVPDWCSGQMTAEAGLPAVEVSSTFGVLAPAGTPTAIAERLNAALAKIVESAVVKEQFLKQGVYALPPTTPAKAAERVPAEVSR